MPDPNLLNLRLPRLWHGGDYNPEQWPRSVWPEDMQLMQEAKFEVATIGIFSWARLEPEEGCFDFNWLDEVVELLDSAGRYFILATPSAAPPAWLSMKYPDTLRTGVDRTRNLHGNRVNYNLGSKIYRGKCQVVNRKLAERYGASDRLLAWHISNEFGGEDYGLESQEQFRTWLRRKFGDDLNALNQAYWSAFWSHTYSSWEEIEPPGAPYGESSTPGLSLDWKRFVTDQTVEFMNFEAAPLREIAPSVPITTNLMGAYPGLDYRKFAPHLDFISWDSYPASVTTLEDTETWVTTAFTHDLMRSLKKDRPWLLMESTPSSANWYPTMILKPPGTHRFEGFQAIAHGSDGVQYFQWRQGRGGFEQFHGAVVGHAGGNTTRVFKEVQQLGREMEATGDLVGSVVLSEAALVYDWQNRWALEATSGPSQGTRKYLETCRDFYRGLWEEAVSVDLIGEDDELNGYKVVVAPMLFSVRPGLPERLEKFVVSGGILVLTYLSGWVDENVLVFDGGFLQPLRHVAGIKSEELDALREGQGNVLRMLQNDLSVTGDYSVHEFCELIHCEGAKTLAEFGAGFYSGFPAVTQNSYGKGMCYYIAARTGPEFIRRFLASLCKKAEVSRNWVGPLPSGVTAQRRKHQEQQFTFLFNANDHAVEVPRNGGEPVRLQKRDFVLVRS